MSKKLKDLLLEGFNNIKTDITIGKQVISEGDLTISNITKISTLTIFDSDTEIPSRYKFYSLCFLIDLYRETFTRVGIGDSFSLDLTIQEVYQKLLDAVLETNKDDYLTLLSGIIKNKPDFLENDLILGRASLDTISSNYLSKFELPQFLFARVAYTVGATEKTRLEVYEQLSQLRYMHATPTLRNSGDSEGQLSSCFVLNMPDCIEGIYDCYKDIAMISKYGGGLGVYMGDIRPKNSTIRGVEDCSNGILPFIKVINDTVVAIDQLGSRRGSATIFLPINHPDIMDFLEVKRNSGDERLRAHDIHTAVLITDKFMEAVVNDTTITLRHDCSKEPIVMKAMDIWRKLVTSYYETGNPFIVFIDEVNRRHIHKHLGDICSSNLCMEILQATTTAKYANLDYTERKSSVKSLYESGRNAICTLASINLAKCLDNFYELEKTIQVAVRALTHVNKNTVYPTEASMYSGDINPIGLGVMGEAEMLYKLGLTYEKDGKTNPETLRFLDELYARILYYTLNASCDISESPEFFNKDSIQLLIDRLLPDTDIYDIPFSKLKDRISDKGLANYYFLAIAPTSSISLVCDTTSGIEPIIHKELIDERKYGSVERPHLFLYEDNKTKLETAFNISPETLIDLNSVRQKYIDQSISFSLFINPNKAKGRYISDLLIYAWRKKLKTLYYLHSKSPEVTSEIQCEGCQ